MGKVLQTSRPRVLLTARDPATGEAMRVLASALIEDGRAEVFVVAQMPSAELFLKQANITRHLISVPEIEDDDGLLSYAESLLKQLKPDIILTGVSGPGHGIDEAVLAVSPRDNFNPYALQSYWGDVNNAFKSSAQTYLVLDDFALHITKERTGKNAVTIGSIKHSGYSELNTEVLRNSYRESQNYFERDRVIGFFGQPIDSGCGYYATVEKLSSSIQKSGLHPRVIYRPHPKESEEQQDVVIRMLSQGSIELDVDRSSAIESMLCGVDFIVSAFSTCGYDSQQLLRVSKIPMGIPVYLMFEDKLTAWFRDYSGLESIPMSDRDMSIVVDDSSKLDDVFNMNTIDEKRERCWKSIKVNFPENTDLVDSVVEMLVSNYNQELMTC